MIIQSLFVINCNQYCNREFRALRLKLAAGHAMTAWSPAKPPTVAEILSDVDWIETFWLPGSYASGFVAPCSPAGLPNGYSGACEAGPSDFRPGPCRSKSARPY